jgi:hypothetical protein
MPRASCSNLVLCLQIAALRSPPGGECHNVRYRGGEIMVLMHLRNRQ